MKLEDNWKSYEECVIPENACEGQIIETHRAFYSGAIAAFGIVKAACSKPEKEAHVDFDELQNSINNFVASQFVGDEKSIEESMLELMKKAH